MRVSQYKTMLNENGLPELVKEKSSNYGIESLTSPELIAQMMREVFQIHRNTEEYLYEICFTTKMKPIGVFEISHGAIDMAIANPREIFQKALMCGASNIVIVHNHPSGVCEPSKEDVKVSQRVKEVGELIGIKLMDSIIIGDKSLYSFADKVWGKKEVFKW